jgi:bifunctional non-homologous end joining protein LigD
MFAHACKIGLEGVVLKVRDGRYLSGRGRDWVKTTCAQRETLTIAGFALDGNDWDGIYVGRRKGDDLIYAGKVDHGFDKKSAADLRRRLTPLIRKTQPYAKRISHKGIWVEPELNAEIEYRAKSAEGRFAIPSSRACGRTCNGRFRSFLEMGKQTLDSGLTIPAEISPRDHVVAAGSAA